LLSLTAVIITTQKFIQGFIASFARLIGFPHSLAPAFGGLCSLAEPKGSNIRRRRTEGQPKDDLPSLLTAGSFAKGEPATLFLTSGGYCVIFVFVKVRKKSEQLMPQFME